MPIQFDPVNKWILITQPTVDVSAQDIYNQAMDWSDQPENMQYTPPMRATGKFPLGGGVYTDTIYILQSGWKIKFWSGNYQATVRGTVITDDGTPRTVPPDTGNVEVVFQVSSQGIVFVTGSAVTEQDKLDIADRVWDEDLDEHNVPKSGGKKLKHLEPSRIP